jgi:SAM-dependent methyltransferase
MNERTFRASEAHRLDLPERLNWMPPREAIDLLELKSGMIVADIGAGTGYFALPFSQAVQPNGKIWAVDLQMGMLDVLAGKLASFDGDIELLQGTAHETHLPVGSCDLAFLGNIWHELDDRAGALAEVERILRPNGRIAIVDWRTGVDYPPGPPPDHRIAAADVEAQLLSAGWQDVKCNLYGKFSYLISARPRGVHSGTSGVALL